MKIAAVGVASSNLTKTLEFYSLLGFEFESHSPQDQHIEPRTSQGGIRLMIDTVELMEEILGEPPVPGNHSSFAIELENTDEVDILTAKVEGSGYEVVKHPWDAPWGQRYAVIADPDGYMIDLFAYI